MIGAASGKDLCQQPPLGEEKMDETNRKLVTYLGARSRAGAGELAVLVGLTIPSIRYRLFQLMAKGIVGQEKARDHRVWWFLQPNEKDEVAKNGDEQ